jgi:hypothetical protein
LTGGIVAFAASGSVTVASGGAITVVGMGYTGGTADSNDPGGTIWYKQPGESYFGVGLSAANTTDGANFGGGAGGGKIYGCEGSGGGGGGYSVPGGNGGAEQVNCAGFPGGVGGNAYGDSALSRVYFGSGGGAGGYSSTLPDGNGGAGGGMVFVFGSSSITLGGTIDASGAPGHKETTGAGADYGGGGGGAGGSIYLMSSTITGTANALVNGGVGGGVNNVANVEIGGNGAPGRVATVP